MTITNMGLVKVAAIGGMATITMGYLYIGKLQHNVKNSLIYQEGLKEVRLHPAALHLLGEPIRDGTVDVRDRIKNFTNINDAQITVPVNGTKQKGVVYISAVKSSEKDQWTLSRVELEVANQPDKRLLVKKI